MKKAYLAFIAVCALSLGLSSCGSKELKSARVLVKSVEIVNDSIKSMVVTMGDEEKTVTLLDARLQNGFALQGDSVILDYIDGKDNTLRALVVTVLPKPAHYFEPSDTLITTESIAADSIQ